MSPTGRFTTAVPLVFIMVVSAIKEIFEDFKRHVEDRAVNRSKVKALRRVTEDGPSQWVDIMWNEVVVGDFLKITSGQFFPADLVSLGLDAFIRRWNGPLQILGGIFLRAEALPDR